MNIEANIKEVITNIKKAAEKSGRDAQSIQLVTVSKNVSTENIHTAYNTGLRAFGENRVQEWLQKYPLLPSECEWHIIGRLQTNKIKYLSDRVALIHSLDRFSLLEKLNSEGEKRGIIWRAIEEVNDFIAAIKNYHYVKALGLMTIGALDAGKVETKGFFRKLKEIRDKLIRQGTAGDNELPHLSMGMSQDYELAVEEGATIVRVGSKIFG